VSSQVWLTSTPDRRQEGEYVGRGVPSLRFHERSDVRGRGITGEVLHLSPEWAGDAKQRAEASVPEQVRFAAKECRT